MSRLGLQTRPGLPLDRALLGPPQLWTSNIGCNLVQNLGYVSAVASSTVNTWGAWTLAGTVSQDIDHLQLVSSGVGANGTNTSSLAQVGLGESGAEIPLFTCAVGGSGTATNSFTGIVVNVPAWVKAGEKISVRSQSIISSKSVPVQFNLYRKGIPSLAARQFDSLGVLTASSAGTNLNNTAYTEIVASTARAYSAITINLAMGNSSMNAGFNVDAAVGAVGSEVVIGQRSITANTGELCGDGGIVNIDSLGICGRLIPAGSRLSVYTSAFMPSTMQCILIGTPA